MKLIVEKIDNDIYVYTESEKHHKVVEPKRGKLTKANLTKVDPELLDHECNLRLNDYLPQHNWYMVFNLKGK